MQKRTLLVIFALGFAAIGVARSSEHAKTREKSSHTAARSAKTAPRAKRRTSPSASTRGRTAARPARTTRKIVTYKIQKGDNDWTIAKRTGLTVKQLRRINGNARLDRIRPGRTLKIAKTVAIPAVRKHAPIVAKRSRRAVVSRPRVARRTPVSPRRALVIADLRREKALRARKAQTIASRVPRPRRPITSEANTVTITDATVAASEAALAGRPTQPMEPSSPAPAPAPAIARAPIARVATARAGRGTVEGILKEADTFRGVRYVYGAMSRGAVDCSGFTTQVFVANGYRVPRTSAEQSRIGTEVSRADIQAGDLVFFKTIRGTRVSHVGIAVGGGKFIHASSGGGRVMVSSLSQSYYYTRFVTARRIIKGGPSAANLVKSAKEAEATGKIAVNPKTGSGPVDVVPN